jgi:hypothetical protein
VLERIVLSRISPFLQDKNLLDNHQSAYRPNHSIETALLKVENDILKAMDKGKLVALVLLDLSAAFDTVDHCVLISQLQRLGFDGTVITWFTSYLSNRSQYVQIRGQSSPTSDLIYGVPQGSVLGPVLFSIYTSTLGNILCKYSDINYHFYADDSQIYMSFNPNQADMSFAIDQLQLCIAEIREWMCSNFLKLNDDKTEFIVFGSKSQREKVIIPEILIGTSYISPRNKVRNLGAFFDTDLSLHDHISQICKASSFHLRNIGLIRKYLTKEATEQLVHAFVSSRLDMGNSLLYGLPDIQIKRLRRLQNIAARIVTRTNPRAHITPVLKELHWLPIQDRVVFKLLIYVYRSKIGMSPSYLTDLLTPYIPARDLRSSNKDLLTVPRTFTTYGNRSFGSAAPSLWNALPDYIKCATSLNSFKSKLKTFLMKDM